MATNRIADSKLALGERSSAFAALAGDLKTGFVTTEKTASDNNGSVLRLFVGVPVECSLEFLRGMTDALTGATAVNIGIYQTDGGAEIDQNLFADSVNISAGSTHASPFDFLQGVDLAYLGLNIRDLYAAVNPSASPLSVAKVDICLTGTTFGTATGTISASVGARVQ